LKYIWNGDVTDASVNLALEEYVLRHFQEDDGYLLFYVNAPAIILGRNQIAAEEINSRVVADRGI
jgi:lipoate-protein ligase A